MRMMMYFSLKSLCSDAGCHATARGVEALGLCLLDQDQGMATSNGELTPLESLGTVGKTVIGNYSRETESPITSVEAKSDWACP